MSSFTKSILYSTTVLVAGLIATFTIYNNSTSEDTMAMASMPPMTSEGTVNELNQIIATAESMQETVSGDIAASMDSIETAAGNIEGAVSDTRERIKAIQNNARTPAHAEREVRRLQDQVIRDSINMANPDSVADMEASQAELDAAIAQAAAAQNDLNSAGSDLTSAQRSYDLDPTEDNALALSEAQADYNAALQVTTDLQNTASTY